MVPSAFALVVLLVGVILIHFGLAEIDAQLGNIHVIPTADVTNTPWSGHD